MRGARSLNFARWATALAVLATMPAVAAHAGTFVSDAQITLVSPLSIINSKNLDFGRIIPSTVATTVTISPTNVRTATNGAVLVGNDYRAARFGGLGTQNQRVRIEITTATITLNGPGPSMTVSNFLIGTDATLDQLGQSSNYRIQPADGIFWFTVGGTLNVGANQPGGVYSGTFTVTADYQ